MGNFYNAAIVRVARKRHRCAYCGGAILAGDSYSHQKGRWDDRWFDAKMHHECHEDLCESGEEEYTPYANERPVC